MLDVTSKEGRLKGGSIIFERRGEIVSMTKSEKITRSGILKFEAAREKILQYKLPIFPKIFKLLNLSLHVLIFNILRNILNWIPILFFNIDVSENVFTYITVTGIKIDVLRDNLIGLNLLMHRYYSIILS